MWVVLNEVRDQRFLRGYINRRKNSALSISPRPWCAATTPSARVESAPVGACGSLGRLLANGTARTMAVKTATHNSTIAGIFTAMLHQPQPFPLYHGVIVLPPKPRHRLLCYPSACTWSAAYLFGPRRYGRGVFEGVVVGDCGPGPIIPPGIIPPGIVPPGFICSPGFIWAPGAIIAPGFICSPGFMSAQQAIGPGPLWSSPGPPKLQLRKNPEKKTPATINKPPATMPTHANAWFRRLGRCWEALGCSVVMLESSGGGDTAVVLVMT
jgi:hypothetical protein